MKRILFFIIFQLACSFAFAEVHRFGTFRHISAREFLPSNYVRSIACDSAGLMWIGTTNGVVTFDGYRVKKCPFACGHDHEALAINALRSQPVVYTYDSLYELRNGYFVPLRKLKKDEPPVKPFPIDNEIASKVNGWAADARGNVWAALRMEGLAVVDPEGTISYMSDSPAGEYAGHNISTVFIDNMGLVWVGSTNNGLWWAPASGRNPLFISNYTSENVSFVHIDNHGHLVLGYDGAGLSVDGHKLSAELGTLTSDFVIDIADLGNEHMLVGTYSGGILELDAANKKAEPIKWESEAEQQLVDCTRALCIDSAQRLWIATFHNGLHLAQQSHDGIWRIIKSYDTANSEMPNITITGIAIGGDNKKLAVATPTGMVQIDLFSLELSVVPASKKALILCIDSFDDKWWTGISKGLYWVDSQRGVSGKVNGIDEPVIALASDGSNILYAISYNSIYTVTKQGNGIYNAFASNLDWLPGKEGLSPHAASVTSDGRLLAGGTWGHIDVPPGSLVPSEHKPVRFMGFSLNGTDYATGSLLPTGLPIDVEISDLTYWGGPKFEYSLDNSPWSIVDTDGVIHLGALSAGRYMLSVRHQGNIDEAYKLTFTVGTWTQHWIFRAVLWLLAFMALITIALYVRRRILSKKAYEVRALPVEPPTDTPDAKFLRKAASVIESKMEEEGFGVEKLASELGMSRATLFRKVKALTGQTPLDLLQSMRLERAHSLLSQQGMSVQDAAWAVGMNPRQFSTAYKKKFGVSPKKDTK